MRSICCLLFIGVLLCGIVHVCGFSRAIGRPEVQPAEAPGNVLAEFPVGKNGRLLQIEAVVCGRPVLFLIDTNVSKTIFDLSLRPLLGEPQGRVELETTGERINVESFKAPLIDLKQLTVQPEGSVVCFDLREIRVAGGSDIRGVLGMDVLSRYVVTFDFDAGLLRLTKELGPEEVADATEVPLVFSSQVPLVNARINEVPHLFRVDTGSTDCCIMTAHFRALVENDELRAGPTYSVMTPSGSVTARFGIVNRFQLASFTHESLPFEDGPMSLLGLPYLARFRWTFDFPQGSVYIRPGRNFAHTDFLGTSGLVLQRIDGRLVIVGIKPTSEAAKVAQVGDEVVALDGVPATEIDLFQVRQVLTQRSGSSVELGLLRNDKRIVCHLRTRDRLDSN